MKHVSRIRVQAPPEAVWPWVAHPDRVMLWNDKLVAHEAPELDRISQGTRFRVTYAMAHPVEVWAEVATWRPPTEVEIRYEDDERGGPTRAVPTGPGRRSRQDRARWMSGLGRGGWASEAVRLEPDGDGTTVVRTIRIHAPAMPWLVRALGSLVLRFGSPVSETHLEELGRLVEGRA